MRAKTVEMRVISWVYFPIHLSASCHFHAILPVLSTKRRAASWPINTISIPVLWPMRAPKDEYRAKFSEIIHPQPEKKRLGMNYISVFEYNFTQNHSLKPFAYDNCYCGSKSPFPFQCFCCFESFGQKNE